VASKAQRGKKVFKVMAEQADKPKRKRVVKSPETFRQRADKITLNEKAPSNSLFSKAKKALAKFLSPIKEALIKFFSAPVFKPFAKPLRIIGKIIVPPYIRKSWQELKLVTWPDLKTSRQLTFAVLVFAIVFGAAIAGVDYGLDKVFKTILLK
jgi:preprotein translocase SecE subunit